MWPPLPERDASLEADTKLKIIDHFDLIAGTSTGGILAIGLPWDAMSGRIYVFKTAHDPRLRYDVEAPGVDFALATSAAPTYFAAAPFPTQRERSYVDGGVWANCPALVRVDEATAILKLRVGGGRIGDDALHRRYADLLPVLTRPYDSSRSTGTRHPLRPGGGPRWPDQIPYSRKNLTAIIHSS
jgi:hypothetical protein